MTAPSLASLFESFGLDPARFAAGDLLARSPIDGAVLGRLPADTPATLSAKIARAEAAQRRWRAIPAPRRGELVRLWGEELRAHKQALGALVTLEAGKIRAEGEGEVQEMIDMAEFATGQSRQLYGLTIASERPGHRMMETWHPLGVVGVITAFNFPVAVFAWNAMLALVCGDALVWKPSEKTPLTALAVLALFARACRRFGDAPEGLIEVAQGDASIGQALADDPRVPLVSATGSTRMGATLAPRVAQRFGRALLELGGNNGMIVTPSAELDLALRTILFSAIGTAGQRCTTLRRLIVHANSADALVARLKTAYATATVGDPREPGTLVGPLIDRNAFDAMQAALAEARAEGGVIHGGERLLAERFPAAAYVRPAIVELPQQSALVRRETFAPILYVLRYSEFDEALALHNDVPQGLASAIFTNDLREAERFIAASDCGIANVNIGPSGAEIGGAFGGEKATGGGREAGSEAWKAYMRRATNTINYSLALPLAQGISFGPTG